MKQYPFIDMHTHMFNAKYLPLEGILRSWEVPFLIAKPVSIILLLLVKSSDFSKDQTETLEGSYYYQAQEDDAILYRGIFKRLVKALQKYGQKSLEEAGDTRAIEDAKQALEDIVHQFRDDGLKSFTLNDVFDGLSDKNISDDVLLESPEMQEAEKALFWALQEVERTAESSYLHESHGDKHNDLFQDSYFDEGNNKGVFRSAWKVLRFILTFMDSERQIYSAIQQDYSKNAGPDAFEPTLLINVMMDMEQPYKAHYKYCRSPKWEFREQITRMLALQAEASGQLVTFAAVDPFRKNWEEYMDLIISREIIGVKIYPPMGFRVANPPNYKFQINTKVISDEYWPEPNSEKMNARLEGILRKARNANLRIFTHCTPTGFEAKTGYGLNADPAFWDYALNKYQIHDLWLCLGHGGGTRPEDWGGWAATDANWDKTFASRVISMCRKYPNVYCDLGYLLELFENSKDRKCAFNRLKAELNDHSGAYPFAQKVMYGSDWHMMDMIGRSREYLNLFYEFFEKEGLSKMAPDFFDGNARQYLGISATV